MLLPAAPAGCRRPPRLLGLPVRIMIVHTRLCWNSIDIVCPVCCRPVLPVRVHTFLALVVYVPAVVVLLAVAGCCLSSGRTWRCTALCGFVCVSGIVVCLIEAFSAACNQPFLLLPQPKGNDDGRQQAPGCGPGALRFAAHFALALRATGVLAEPSWEEDQYDPLQVRPE